MSDPTSREGEAIARLSHLEPLLSGCRALVVAAPGESRACESWLAARGLSGTMVATGEEGHAGPFDGILVLPGAGGALDAARVGRLRARLSTEGWLAVSPGPEEEAAEAALRDAFPAVEAAALVPLAGWAVLPAGPSGAGLVWDGTALPSARPASRLLVGCRRPSGLAGTTVVALACGPAAGGSGAPGLEAGGAAQLGSAREAELVSEAAALAWRAGELSRALDAAVAERDALRARLGRGDGGGTGGLPDLLSP